jgi:hypothetical protein
MIKQRIESLIEREYLKRDDVDKARFIYLPWVPSEIKFRISYNNFLP